MKPLSHCLWPSIRLAHVWLYPRYGTLPTWIVPEFNLQVIRSEPHQLDEMAVSGYCSTQIVGSNSVLPSTAAMVYLDWIAFQGIGRNDGQSFFKQSHAFEVSWTRCLHQTFFRPAQVQGFHQVTKCIFFLACFSSLPSHSCTGHRYFKKLHLSIMLSMR